MKLLDNYLAAVEAELPPALRADVVAELRDTLLNKLEEKEASLGRPPSPDETADVLKAFGHPLVIAARYRRHQHLIGPEIYPFYVRTLQVVLGVVALLNLIGLAFAAPSAGDTWALIGRTWTNATLPALFIAFATVTIVFLVMERTGGGAHLAHSWSPRALGASPPKRPKRIWETLVEMALGAVFLLWWSGAVRFGDSPTALTVFIAPGPVWASLHWPIFAVVAASLAVNALLLLQPDRLRTIALGRAAVVTACVVVMIVLIASDPLFVIPGASDAAHPISRGVKIGLVIGTAVWTFRALAALARFDAWRAPTAAPRPDAS
jgi:hypothetical protein